MKTHSKTIRTYFFRPTILAQVDDLIDILWTEGFLNDYGRIVLTMISWALTEFGKLTSS